MRSIRFPRQVRILTAGLFILSLSLVLALNVMAKSKEPLGNSGRGALAPHKALYNIELVSTKSGSQIVNVSGQMLYEWQPSCDAWTSNHRFNLSYEYADSPAMRITSDFSTYETYDGRSLNFSSQRKRDGRLFEELRGQATIDENGKGTALYTKPKGLEFELPEGALFPAGHTLGVLDAIARGKKFYKAVIFDGSDEQGPVEVNTFIGDIVDVLALHPDLPEEVDRALLVSPGRKVRLAFFPLSGEESTADYEMSMVFHDNGVVSEMHVEYDDFSIRQNLIALESLENACESDVSAP